MILHAAILIAAGREWGQYLEDLRNQIQRLDKEATYSSVRKSRRANFSITFDERQKIHQCRSKLLKALHALDIDIDIIQGYKARYRHLAKTRGSQRSDTSLQDFEWHLTELRAHRTATIRIMGHCTWTANLQEKILEYRNDETMQAHIQALRDCAAAQKSEGENMTRLTRQTVQDSKTLKALTIMASLYLPATLLATTFSSSLVQQMSTDDVPSNTHFVIAQDFWVYIVVMMPMTAITALFVMLMRRRAARMIR